MMQITENFTLEELVQSKTATTKGIDNTAPPAAFHALVALCKNVLQPARNAIGNIQVTSGYRCPKLNKIVGGSVSSQHVKGEAADLVCEDKAKLFNYIKDNLVFDQLIWENGTDSQPAWVHVSYSMTHNRKQVLRKKQGGGYESY
jgi:hypothetical protein